MEKIAKEESCPARENPIYAVDEETTKEISRSCRITPLYETAVFDHIYQRHSSMLRNHNLACQWDKYKKNIETRVITPYHFPDQRDIHFYNCDVRFLPSLSDHKRPTFRKTLKPGPGVDFRGQMPIPQELHMKRSGPVKETKDKKKKSTKDEKTTKAEKSE